MKQIKLKINDFGWGSTEAYLDEDRYLKLTFMDGEFDLYCAKYGEFIYASPLKTNVKRLSTINKVANKYGIEFILDI